MGKAKREIDKYMGYSDYQKFITYLKKGEKFWYMLFATQGILGTRIQETLLLTWEDIDFKNQRVLVPTLKRDKDSPLCKTRTACTGQEFKVFPIALTFKGTPWLFQLLLDFYRETKTKEIRKLGSNPRMADLLFPVSRQAAHLAFKEVCKKAGLNPRYSTHSLRHLQGVLTYSESKDINYTAIRLRHKKVDTSFKYMHMMEAEDSEISRKVGAVMTKLMGEEE